MNTFHQALIIGINFWMDKNQYDRGVLRTAYNTVCPKTTTAGRMFVSHAVQTVVFREPAIPAVEARRKVFLQESFSQVNIILIEPELLKRSELDVANSVRINLVFPASNITGVVV